MSGRERKTYQAALESGPEFDFKAGVMRFTHLGGFKTIENIEAFHAELKPHGVSLQTFKTHFKVGVKTKKTLNNRHWMFWAPDVHVKNPITSHPRFKELKGILSSPLVQHFKVNDYFKNSENHSENESTWKVNDCRFPEKNEKEFIEEYKHEIKDEVFRTSPDVLSCNLAEVGFFRCTDYNHASLTKLSNAFKGNSICKRCSDIKKGKYKNLDERDGKVGKKLPGTLREQCLCILITDKKTNTVLEDKGPAIAAAVPALIPRAASPTPSVAVSTQEYESFDITAFFDEWKQWFAQSDSDQSYSRPALVKKYMHPTLTPDESITKLLNHQALWQCHSCKKLKRALFKNIIPESIYHSGRGQSVCDCQTKWKFDPAVRDTCLGIVKKGSSWSPDYRPEGQTLAEYEAMWLTDHAPNPPVNIDQATSQMYGLFKCAHRPDGYEISDDDEDDDSIVGELRLVRSKNKSGYKGVHERNGQYIARLGNLQIGGVCRTAKDAAIIYTKCVMSSISNSSEATECGKYEVRVLNGKLDPRCTKCSKSGVRMFTTKVPESCRKNIIAIFPFTIDDAPHFDAEWNESEINTYMEKNPPASCPTKIDLLVGSNKAVLWKCLNCGCKRLQSPKYLLHKVRSCPIIAGPKYLY